MSDDETPFVDSIFEEPEDFRPPPPQSYFVTYNRFGTDLLTGKDTAPSKTVEPQSIKLRLIGSSPLWGHYLWNAGKFTASFLDAHPELVQGKRILELGAAGGLPSLICALNKADKVVCTDYPDADLVDNIRFNFQQLAEASPESYDKESVAVEGYIWGNEYTPLKSKSSGNGKFDLIILSDLVFNHTEHHKLLKTCQDLKDAEGRCLVVFSPHRAHLLDLDLQFFETAKEYGFEVEKIGLNHWTPMFEEDEETAEIRGRVYSYWLK